VSRKGQEKPRKGDQCSCFQRDRVLQCSGIHYRGSLILYHLSSVHSRGALPFPKTQKKAKNSENFAKDSVKYSMKKREREVDQKQTKNKI
jgi:hypothetical protein